MVCLFQWLDIPKGHKFSMGAVPIHLLNSLRVLRNYLCVLRHIHMPSDSFYTNSKGLDPANKASATTVKDRTLLTVAIVVKLHHLIASDVNASLLLRLLYCCIYSKVGKLSAPEAGVW